MIVLTDEEIARALGSWEVEDPYYDDDAVEAVRICDKAQLKKVAEWIEEMSHTVYGAPSEGDYWCFSKKMWEQSLLDEVKE